MEIGLLIDVLYHGCRNGSFKIDDLHTHLTLVEVKELNRGTVDFNFEECNRLAKQWEQVRWYLLGLELGCHVLTNRLVLAMGAGVLVIQSRLTNDIAMVVLWRQLGIGFFKAGWKPAANRLMLTIDASVATIRSRPMYYVTALVIAVIITKLIEVIRKVCEDHVKSVVSSRAEEIFSNLGQFNKNKEALVKEAKQLRNGVDAVINDQGSIDWVVDQMSIFQPSTLVGKLFTGEESARFLTGKCFQFKNGSYPPCQQVFKALYYLTECPKPGANSPKTRFISAYFEFRSQISLAAITASYHNWLETIDKNVRLALSSGLEGSITAHCEQIYDDQLKKLQPREDTTVFVDICDKIQKKYNRPLSKLGSVDLRVLLSRFSIYFLGAIYFYIVLQKINRKSAKIIP